MLLLETPFQFAEIHLPLFDNYFKSSLVFSWIYGGSLNRIHLVSLFLLLSVNSTGLPFHILDWTFTLCLIGKASSDKIFVTSKIFRHFSRQDFCPIIFKSNYFFYFFSLFTFLFFEIQSFIATIDIFCQWSRNLVWNLGI